MQWRAVVDAVTRAQHRLLDVVEASGVPAQWYAVLHLLLRAEGHRLPMSRLAREVSFTSGGFTKLADRMGREGLIDRRNSDGDRRIVYATLTPAGLTAARAAERIYVAALDDQVLGTLPPDQLTIVADYLAALNAAVAADDQVEVIAPADEVTIAAPRSVGLPDRRSRSHRKNAV
jgi:DNA-binding MarR family transcriptional regulator